MPTAIQQQIEEKEKEALLLTLILKKIREIKERHFKGADDQALKEIEEDIDNL